MNIHLDHIGIIQDSDIQVNGLTVITGKNSSGKTTVGKLLYAIVRASAEMDKMILNSMYDYVQSQVEDVLSSFGMSLLKSSRFFGVLSDAEMTSEWKELSNLFWSVRHRDSSVDLEDYVNKMLNFIESLSLEDIDKILNHNFSSPSRNLSLFNLESENTDIKEDHLLNLKNRQLDKLKNVLNTIRDPDVISKLSPQQMKMAINDIFANQVLPVKDPSTTGFIRISNDETTLLDIQIYDENDYAFRDLKELKHLYSQAIFIDNPFVLDKNYVSLGAKANSFTDVDTSSSTHLSDSDTHLAHLLRSRKSENIFDLQDLRNSTQSVIEKINEIVPGEFIVTRDGNFYLNDGAKLKVANLAAGSKQFSIIKTLLMNGHLTSKTLLILDEPESHLHPKWINSFAEILVLLICELRLHVLLTTHSPNLLLALDYYSKKYPIRKNAHFYLAIQEDDGFSHINNIDNNISDAYTHLAEPFVWMSMLNDAIEE